MKRRLKLAFILTPTLLCLGCASSPGELAAYQALDDGYRLIRPYAEAGLAARNLPPAEADHVRTTFANHQRVIDELKGGAK